MLEGRADPKKTLTDGASALDKAKELGNHRKDLGDLGRMYVARGKERDEQDKMIAEIKAHLARNEKVGVGVEINQ